MFGSGLSGDVVQNQLAIGRTTESRFQMKFTQGMRFTDSILRLMHGTVALHDYCVSGRETVRFEYALVAPSDAAAATAPEQGEQNDQERERRATFTTSIANITIPFNEQLIAGKTIMDKINRTLSTPIAKGESPLDHFPTVVAHDLTRNRITLLASTFLTLATSSEVMWRILGFAKEQIVQSTHPTLGIIFHPRTDANGECAAAEAPVLDVKIKLDFTFYAVYNQIGSHALTCEIEMKHVTANGVSMAAELHRLRTALNYKYRGAVLSRLRELGLSRESCLIFPPNSDLRRGLVPPNIFPFASDSVSSSGIDELRLMVNTKAGRGYFHSVQFAPDNVFGLPAHVSGEGSSKRSNLATNVREFGLQIQSHTLTSRDLYFARHYASNDESTGDCLVGMFSPNQPNYFPANRLSNCASIDGLGFALRAVQTRPGWKLSGEQYTYSLCFEIRPYVS